MFPLYSVLCWIYFLADINGKIRRLFLAISCFNKIISWDSFDKTCFFADNIIFGPDCRKNLSRRKPEEDIKYRLLILNFAESLPQYK